MSSEAVSAPSAPHVAYPAPISLGQLWPWGIFAMALLLLVYFVGIDEGASSVIPGMTLHEWVHDGRHLLGFPCH